MLTNPLNNIHELGDDAENSCSRNEIENGEENSTKSPYFICPNLGNKSTSGSIPEQCRQSPSGSASSESASLDESGAGGHAGASNPARATRQHQTGCGTSPGPRESSLASWQQATGLSHSRFFTEPLCYKWHVATCQTGAGPDSGPDGPTQSRGNDDASGRPGSSAAKFFPEQQSAATEDPARIEVVSAHDKSVAAGGSSSGAGDG
jgi:hypothetical protein